MLQDNFNEMMQLYDEIKREIKRRAPHEYERWKAGGYTIDEDIMSMYPNMGQIVEELVAEDDKLEQQDAEDED